MSATEDTPLYERRRYRQPPIIEAVCEFRFAQGTADWNPAIPGLLYERLRTEYPETPRQQLGTGVEFEPQSPSSGRISLTPATSVELSDADERNSVVLAPNLLVVRVRTPYPGWETFHGRIVHVLSQFAEVSGEAAVHRIGIRYVNRVVVQSENVRLDEYFNAPPSTPDDFPESLVGVFARFESHYEESDQRDVRLVYTFASAPEENGSAFMLDLDVIEFFQQAVPLGGALPLTDLKSKETAAFEAIITDRTRDLIDAD